MFSMMSPLWSSPWEAPAVFGEMLELKYFSCAHRATVLKELSLTTFDADYFANFKWNSKINFRFGFWNKLYSAFDPMVYYRKIGQQYSLSSLDSSASSDRL